MPLPTHSADTPAPHLANIPSRAAAKETSRLPTDIDPMSFASVGMLLLTLFCCAGAVAQIWTTLREFQAGGDSPGMSLVRTASFLTNWTIVLASCVYAMASLRMTPLRRWIPAYLTGAPQITAITFHLVTVGIGYNVLFRGYGASLSGFRAVVDETVHTIVPVLAMIYWVVFVPRYALTRRRGLLWLIYPIGYLCITLWRGSIDHYYPYAVINVAHFGYARVMTAVSLVIAGMLVLMDCFVQINRRRTD